MSIGGTDVVLLAPKGESIADAILHACAKHWPKADCQFQDANEEALHPLSDSWVWTVGAGRREFSVYRDAAAVASWREFGASKKNANTMFHFIIGEPSAAEPKLVEVAMVFDKMTFCVRGFIHNLQEAFLFLMAKAPSAEAA